jgi:hypothetical protein
VRLPTDIISGVVEQTRQQIAAMKRDGAEQAGMQWRDNFRPHAVIAPPVIPGLACGWFPNPKRARPEPIFVAAIIGAERLLRVDFDFDGERKSYIKISGRSPTQASEMARNDSCFRTTYWINCQLCAQLCRSL